MKKNVTKRLFTLLLAATLVFPLISCGGKAPEVNDPEPNTPVVSNPPETQTPERIEPRTWSDFENWYFWGKAVLKSEGELYAEAYIIRSVEELQMRCDSLTENEKTSFAEAFAKCDEQYFENHTLVLMVLPFGHYININYITEAELTKDEDGTRLLFNLIGKMTADVSQHYHYCYIALSTEEEIDIDASEKIDVYYGAYKMTK